MPPHPLMFERHDVLPYATLAFGLLRAILAIAATSLLTLLPHNINPAFLILAGACRVYVKLVYLLKEPDYGVVEEIVGLGDWADDDWVWDDAEKTIGPAGAKPGDCLDMLYIRTNRNLYRAGTTGDCEVDFTNYIADDVAIFYASPRVGGDDHHYRVIRRGLA
ncbi:hypothetical protein F4780DRAFT_779769 [Xylariomycetidae sp. FL0641]|nr:hypothetical protein F4780DRAFT_779769 [Xylariomycetidae sp. FL0641]